MKKTCTILFIFYSFLGVTFAGNNIPNVSEEVTQKWVEAWPWAHLYSHPTFKINHFVFLNKDKTIYASGNSSSGMESVYKTPDDDYWYALSIDDHNTVYAITGGLHQTGQIYKLTPSTV